MRPFLMRHLPLRLRVPVFYRLHASSAASRPDLFERAPLALEPGVCLDLVPTDVAHGPIAWTGVYELVLSRRLHALARSGGLLVDVGANYGYFTCLWASASPRNRVVAFEASPRNTDGLRRNVEANGFGEQVEVESRAVGSETGQMTFRLGPPGQTGWGHLRRDAQDPGDAVVEVVRLDDVCRERGIGHVDVLKIDVEGADALVLEGAERLLAERRVGAVFFEEVPGHVARLGLAPGTAAGHLRRAGYSVAPLAPGEFVATPS